MTVYPSDLKFDHTAPRGQRVRLRPPSELQKVYTEAPQLATAVSNLLDPRTTYGVEVVYVPTDGITMVRLISFPQQWFNAILFERASRTTAPGVTL